MFYEVKIFDKSGKVKKVLSGQKLSKDYWSSFFSNSLGEAKEKNHGKKPKKKTYYDDESID